MGTVASNAATYAGMFVPDRDQLVEWGLINADEEKAIKASKNNAAKQQRKLKKEMKPLFKALNLRDRDMQAYFEAYSEVDIDGVLSISYSNFCEFFHIIPNRFIEAIFFDFNPEKNMTFQHFVVSTFYYCLASPRELATMIFQVYDRAKMGKIYPPTVMQLVREMYDKGFRFEPHATMAVVKLINTHEKQWGIDEATFVEILFRHQQPATEVQKDLKRLLFNAVFWKKCSKNSPLIGYGEAWQMQKELEEKMIAAKKLEADMALYRSRGGEWKEGAPIPAAIAAGKKFEEGATVTPTVQTAGPTPATGAGAFDAKKITRIGGPKKRLHPKGIPKLLVKAKRDILARKKMFVPGGGDKENNQEEDSPAKRVRWESQKLPNIVRPKKLKIRDQRIPQTMGGDEFESARNVIRNFEALTSGRDVGKLMAELATT